MIIILINKLNKGRKKFIFVETITIFFLYNFLKDFLTESKSSQIK